MVSPSITIKADASQWYWSFEYSDYLTESGDFIQFDSYMVPAHKLRELISWVELSNSGEILKLLIPNYNGNIISGWANYLGMVISQMMIESEMDYRGSKLNWYNAIFWVALPYQFVKEQRVDGSYPIKWWSIFIYLWINYCFYLISNSFFYRIKVYSNDPWKRTSK